MAVPQSVPGNRLADIRTMSDLLTETSNPQRKFMKLAMLAMERARRGKERESARKRIESIDCRLSEIKDETGALLQVAAEAEACLADQKERAPRKQSASPATSGFKLKY